MITFKNENNARLDRNFQYFGFICNSRMKYYSDIMEPLNNGQGTVDKVIYGIFDRRGGCVNEFIMTWYSINGENAPQLEVFSDYFNQLPKPWHMEIVRRLNALKKPLFTPEEFSRILLSLGFEDDSYCKLNTDTEGAV